MFAAWNEQDPSAVRARLDAVLFANVRFVDPTIDLVGIDEFEANVHRVHEQIPGATYRRSSRIDEHHGCCRYSWEILLDGERILEGADVTLIDHEDRIAAVIGFFGPLHGDRDESAPGVRR